MRAFLSLKTCLLSVPLPCVNSTVASKITPVPDFGLKPDRRINAVPLIQKAIDACRQHPGSTFVFPKGRYDFWVQYAIEKDYYKTNTYGVNPKILAVLLEQINDLTIDGDGSEFIMYGRMQPFILDHRRDITLRNFSVDREIPSTAQGIVTQSTSEYLEIEINSHQYPYIIENKRLTFVGEGQKSSLWAIMQFDPDTHLVLPNTGDNSGWRSYDITEINPGLVRLPDPRKEADKFFPAPGTALVL